MNDNSAKVDSENTGNHVIPAYSQKTNLPIMKYSNKNIAISSVALFKPENEKVPVVYATGSDKSIREISLIEKGKGKTTEQRYEEGIPYSQIVMGFQRKAIFCGTAYNYSGSI